MNCEDPKLTLVKDEDGPEAAQRAREDALKDMEAEGLDGDDPLHGVRTGFVSSYHVTRDNGEHQHGLVRVLADSYPEAVGKSYLEVSAEYQAEEGWGPPHILTDDQPFLVLPDVDAPVATRRQRPADDPCALCGSDDPCDDPAACENWSAAPGD
jgi:hypothetical protein